MQKVMLITGASRGIGAATARLAAQRGEACGGGADATAGAGDEHDLLHGISSGT